MTKAYLWLIDFVLPLPMTALMYYLWYRRTGSSMFAAYVLVLGVLFGYLYPGIGTNVLHLWKFNGPFRIKNYFIHHGFIYAPYLALVFYVAFAAGEPLTGGNIVRVVLCSAFIQSVVSCHHDICGVRTGMIEIRNTPAKLKKSPVEIVMDSGVAGFWLVGASYAISGLIAYHCLVVKAMAGVETFLLLVILGLGIMGAPALQYVMKNWAHISRAAWPVER